MAATCPSTVRIAGSDWTITLDDERLRIADAGGLTLADEHLIILPVAGTDANRREAMIHELMHAAANVTEGSDRMTDEEQSIRVLAVPMLAILRDNAGLAKWLLK